MDGIVVGVLATACFWAGAFYMYHLKSKMGGDKE